MLILKDMIAHGRVRACYFHPKRSNLCVKVALKPAYNHLLKKEIKNNARFQHAIRPYVPRYYGLIKTNKGLGLISDLIYDDNNHLSLSLTTIHQKQLITQDLIQQLEDFFSRVLRYHLWFYDFNAENFLVRMHHQKQQLVFVDTKSLNRHNSWSTLKLEYIFPWLAKYRVLRRIRRLYLSCGLPIPKQFL